MRIKKVSTHLQKFNCIKGVPESLKLCPASFPDFHYNDGLTTLNLNTGRVFMKLSFVLVICAFLCVPNLWAQQTAPFKTEKDKESYVIGINLGTDMKRR